MGLSVDPAAAVASTLKAGFSAGLFPVSPAQAKNPRIDFYSKKNPQPPAANVGAPPRSQRRGPTFSTLPLALNNFLPVDHGGERRRWRRGSFVLDGAIYHRADPSNRIVASVGNGPSAGHGCADGLGGYCYRSIF